MISGPFAKQLKLKSDLTTSVTIGQAEGDLLSNGRVKVNLTIGNQTREVYPHIIPNFRHPFLIGLDIGDLFDLHVGMKRLQVHQTLDDDQLHLCLSAIVSQTSADLQPIVAQNADAQNQTKPTVQTSADLQPIVAQNADPQNQTEQTVQTSADLQHTVQTAADLQHIVAQNADLFAHQNLDVGHTDIAEHKIRLKDETHQSPIALRPYRHSQADQLEIRKQTTVLKAKGLIRDSNSPWSFPVTLANKKDGTKRLCIDYRRLNAVTIDEREPMPLISDVIDRLSKCKVFSTLDIAWGYWHVPVHPDSRPMTAFITADGHYEWTVMPFGLKNAPRTFQRAIRQALGDLFGHGVDPYMDDIIIATEDFPSHVRLLNKVFQRLRTHRFRLRESKCLFGKNKIEYLGFLISNGTIRPSPRKLEAVANFPVPTDVKCVQRFIGLAN